MKNKQKGMVLVVVLMIATIILILVGGLSAIIGSNLGRTTKNINESKFYNSAEAGINYGLHWMRMGVSTDSLQKKKSADKACKLFNLQNTTFWANACSVKVRTYVDTTIANSPPIWRIVSRAGKGADSCIITYSNIMLQSPFNHCFFQSETGTMSGYFSKNQNFYGKTYFNGEIYAEYKDGKMPTFFGEVESTRPNDSYAPGVDFTKPLLKMYKYGLKVERTGGTLDDSKMLDAFNNEAFPAGYTAKAADQPLSAMTQSWSDLINPAKNPGTKKLTDLPGFSFNINKDVTIKFTLDSAGQNVAGARFISVEHNGNKAIIRQNEKTKLLCIPDVVGNVKVSGVVSTDMSVVTQKANVYLDGDLYSEGLTGYEDDNQNGFDDYAVANTNHPINKIMANTVKDYNLGIIVGVDATSETNFYVTPSGTSGSDVILLSAGVYVPKGYLKKVGDWSGKYTKLILYGGFIGKNEGTTEDGYTGFSPNYINSPKYLRGAIPPGFKPSKEKDPVTGNDRNRFSDNLNWSVVWKH